MLGTNPFEGKSYDEVLEKNKRSLIDFKDPLYGALRRKEKRLLIEMLEKDPFHRISAEKALEEVLNLADESPESIYKGSNSPKPHIKLLTKKSSIESNGSPDIIKLSPKLQELPPFENLSEKEKPKEDKPSLPFVMRSTIMNGHNHTIEGLPTFSETEEKKSKFKKGLTVKIYRFPTIDIQSPDLQKALKNATATEEKEKITPETLGEPNCNNNCLISIKEEEEDKKNY